LAEFRRVGARHSRSIAQKMTVLSSQELRDLTEISDKLRAGAPPTWPA
jgi:hypothetical protein